MASIFRLTPFQDFFSRKSCRAFRGCLGSTAGGALAVPFWSGRLLVSPPGSPSLAFWQPMADDTNAALSQLLRLHSAHQMSLRENSTLARVASRVMARLVSTRALVGRPTLGAGVPIPSGIGLHIYNLSKREIPDARTFQHCGRVISTTLPMSVLTKTL